MFPQLTSLTTVLLSLLASSTPFNETISGLLFLKSGPHHLLPKISYEWSSAQTALNPLKTNLGPDGLITTLQPEILKADSFWKAIIANSSSSDNWVAASGRVVAFLGPAITAARFAAWTQTPLAGRANNAANPEHYVKRTVRQEDGTLLSEILEGWGGVTTHFTIRNYTTPDRVKYPFLHELPEFPLRF